ncbi:MAG: hypothetical protein JXB17_03840, partial [Bacteroidales bacterium]|nr:hypothetical protein [Bacteroidales bacterium]
QVLQLFESFKNSRILIIGDVMIDSYIWGDVTRISPEAPVQVLSASKKEYRLGGAANVAKNIQSLGAIPILCSVIGKDTNGFSFNDLLKQNNINSKWIIKDEQRITTMKTRAISGHQHLLRIDEEITEYLSESTEKKFIETINSAISSENISSIVVQDYNKGILSAGVIKYIINISKEKNIPLLVDPKRNNFGLYENLTLLKPNFKELKEGLKIDINKNEIDKIVRICQTYLSEKNIDSILLTLSENGILICTKDKFHHVPAKIRDVSDVSGAGDTVISTASLCVANKLSIYDIANISNIAGGIVCEKVGVVPVNKEKLIEELIEKEV